MSFWYVAKNRQEVPVDDLDKCQNALELKGD